MKRQGLVWQMAATILCLTFGTILTLNIQPVGDGMWFWYARFFREHQRLYADMHLPLQPLFVLLTAAMQTVFGLGWLQSKILAVVQLGLYCWGLLIVCKRLRLGDLWSAGLLAACFFLTLTAIYFRFDDYHITGYVFLVWSIYLLLILDDTFTVPRLLGISAALGILSGLSMSNRLNDGAALLAACLIILPFALRRIRLAGVVVLTGFAAATFAVVIWLTGDTMADWRLESLVRAAAVKGATGHVWKRPFRFFFYHLTSTLYYKHTLLNLLFTAAFIALAVWLRRSGVRKD